ncbi:MAG: crotonyl-CoA carboxylase/reductase, partial [Actinobacteria bacterium]|nr:crotonyl-CoA carboxylase/reductase [Actinomycetota bacterium]
MRHILDAIEARADSATFAALTIPESYRAAVVLKSEQDTFKGVPSNQKDPRKTVHVQDVPVPEIAPDEVLIAVMASSINFNTVWSSIFEPVSTFGSLARLA